MKNKFMYILVLGVSLLAGMPAQAREICQDVPCDAEMVCTAKWYNKIDMFKWFLKKHSSWMGPNSAKHCWDEDKEVVTISERRPAHYF